MKQALFILISLLVIALHAPAAEAQSAETIRQFASNISISQDNVATITETIEYDFGSNQRHGIYRTIPVRTRAGDTNQFYYYNFELLDASQDNQKAQVKTENQGDYKAIRIGDSNRTISGEHTYTIRYTMAPVIERDTAGDFLNWNITGNEWGVPIDSAIGTVVFEPEVTVNQARCYSGATGSTEAQCATAYNANKASVSAEQLGVGEGLTLNAVVAANSFSNYLAPSDPPPPDLRWAVPVSIGLGGFVLGAVTRLLSWRRYRRTLKHQTVDPEYEPPKGLSAGEIGLLYDNESSMQEITAVMIDLAVKGYIRIEQTRPRSLFRKAEYTFHKLKPYHGVRRHEKYLLDLLFDGGTKDTVELKNIDRNTAAGKIQSIKEDLKKSLERKGYTLPAAATSVNAIWKRILIAGSLALVGWTIFWGVSLLVDQDRNGNVLWPTVIGFAGLLLGRGIAHRTELSPAGYKEWSDIEGLKLYMTVAEKDRMAFHDAPEKNPKLFSALLPFAVALGVEKQWAKQFEGMDVAKETNWYSSQGHFNSYLLARSLSNDFSPAVSSSVTPKQSSGGSGGGGFSGGGGGGGGGGSW